MNYNNPDGTYPIVFGTANMTLTKTNVGTWAYPADASAPTGYTGTYIKGAAHVSNGTNLINITSPSSYY